MVVGGAMVTERIAKDKEKKRLKKEHDETRYRELVEETGRRLSRTESGQVVRQSASSIEEQAGQRDEVPSLYNDTAEVESNPAAHQSHQVRSQDSSHNAAKKKRGFRSFFRKS